MKRALEFDPEPLRSQVTVLFWLRGDQVVVSLQQSQTVPLAST